jgi:hypothetical protein
MSDNDTASTANHHPFNHSSHMVPTVTSVDTLIDLANWWCHYILQNSDLELFDQFSEVLQFLAPMQEGSPLTIRLHCLVVWQELLTQTITRNPILLTTASDNTNHTTSPPRPPVDNRTFEAVQDKLVLLHTKYFAKDSAALLEYEEVLRMIRVHQELSILYGKLKCDGENTENVKAALDQAVQKGRDDIYFFDGHQILPALQDIVVKENGLTTEQRMNGIVDILNNDESVLAVKWLLLKTQILLLHWCEWIIPGGAPVLVESMFRGVGVFTKDPSGGNENDTTNASALNASEENTNFLRTAATAHSSSPPKSTENTGANKIHSAQPQFVRLRLPQSLRRESKLYRADDESLWSKSVNTSPRLASPSQAYRQDWNRDELAPSRPLDGLGDQESARDTENLPLSAEHTAHSTTLTKKMLVKSKLVEVAVVWTKEEKEGRSPGKRINVVC